MLNRVTSGDKGISSMEDHKLPMKGRQINKDINQLMVTSRNNTLRHREKTLSKEYIEGVKEMEIRGVEKITIISKKLKKHQQYF